MAQTSNCNKRDDKKLNLMMCSYRNWHESHCDCASNVILNICTIMNVYNSIKGSHCSVAASDCRWDCLPLRYDIPPVVVQLAKMDFCCLDNDLIDYLIVCFEYQCNTMRAFWKTDGSWWDRGRFMKNFQDYLQLAKEPQELQRYNRACRFIGKSAVIKCHQLPFDAFW